MHVIGSVDGPGVMNVGFPSVLKSSNRYAQACDVVGMSWCDAFVTAIDLPKQSVHVMDI